MYMKTTRNDAQHERTEIMSKMNETKKKPAVKLIGEDGNAFAIIGKCKQALKKAGMHDEAEAFVKEATSGDYNGVLATAMKYCEVD